MSPIIDRGSRTIFAFDEFELRPEDRWLAKNGCAIPLEPKPFELLVYLIERRDSIVTKAELFEAVWKDTRVCSGALTQCVSVVRRAVGDSARRQRVLKTYSKVGYRFIADLRVINGGAHSHEPGMPVDGIISDTREGQLVMPRKVERVVGETRQTAP